MKTQNKLVIGHFILDILYWTFYIGQFTLRYAGFCSVEYLDQFNFTVHTTPNNLIPYAWSALYPIPLSFLCENQWGIPACTSPVGQACLNDTIGQLLA
ncbi:MAG: hypothetical protein B6D64_00485 [Bacteroidetes bacterium 4484_276]|nr:MAG: hypothetical protein B6D64_00485 [Bacteroidetes bacterium 4484_276]